MPTEQEIAEQMVREAEREVADDQNLEAVVRRADELGRKFEADDVTPDLKIFARYWLKALPAPIDFEFLSNMRYRVDIGASLSNLQVKGVLNCAVTQARGTPFAKRVKVEPGVYKIPRDDGDHDVYKVKLTRDKQRTYASRLKQISGSRLNEQDERVQWEWEYAPGAIKLLRPEQRMNEEDAKEFGIRYGICAACGRRLKQADSVERGIGPVCMKWFQF